MRYRSWLRFVCRVLGVILLTVAIISLPRSIGVAGFAEGMAVLELMTAVGCFCAGWYLLMGAEFILNLAYPIDSAHCLGCGRRRTVFDMVACLECDRPAPRDDAAPEGGTLSETGEAS